MARPLTLFFALAALAFLVDACTETPRPVPRDPGPANPVYKVGDPYQVAGTWYTPAEDPGYDEIGVASWYGSDFHGRRTANGDIYDMNQVTAAHPTLPMPSRVRVTNLENGRSLVLSVNDRGPFIRGRIIDISRRGAELLGYRAKGTARVRVQVLGTGHDARPAVKPTATVSDEIMANRVFIQAGAYSNVQNARLVSGGLEKFGQTSVTRVAVDGRSLFRVRLGPIASLDEAGRLLGKVVADGFHDARLVVE